MIQRSPEMVNRIVLRAGRARSPSGPQSPANHRQPTSALQGATTRMLAPPSGSASPNLPSEAELLRRMGAPLRWNAASRRRAAGTAAFPVSAYALVFCRRETLSGKAAILAAGKHLHFAGVKHCLGKPPSWRRGLAPVVAHSPIMVNRIPLRDNRFPASHSRASREDNAWDFW